MRFSRLFYPSIALFAACSAFGNVAPEVVAPVPASTLTSGGAVQEIDLSPVFRDPDVTGSVVRVDVRIGSTIKPVHIALFDQQTPITVANFLAYVNSGRHNNNFFHRSMPGFVVQGGGFWWTAEGNLEAVPTFGPIQNEPGISNVRGTVAMAKVDGNPNSATSQWFVNLANNSTNLDAQNGGFTVFGRVVGSGMAVIDEVAALPRVNAGAPFDTLPVKDFTGGSVFRHHLVETSSTVAPALSFSAVSSNPALVRASVTGSTLQLTPAIKRFGTASVVITATDLDGASTQTEVTVNVQRINFDPVTEPEITMSGALAGASVPESSNAGLPGGSVLSTFGTPAISDFRDLAATVSIKAGRSKLAAIYWENREGDNKLIARQNQSAGVPGAPSAVFKSFRDPLLAPSGMIAFAAKLGGVKANVDDGVWTDLFGNLQPILREGQEIPGLNGLNLKSVTSLSLTDDALLALVKLMPAPGLVTAKNNTALVRISGLGSGSVLAQTGTSFDGATIKALSVLQPAARSTGQGRWHGTKDVVAKLTLSDKRIVIVRFNTDGTPAKLLETGTEDPALGVKLTKLGLPAVGESAVAVLASKALGSGVTAVNDTVLLYAADGETFSEAVRENDAANVADGVVFAGFSDPVTNEQGDMLFFGTLRGAGVKGASKNGLWVKRPAATPVLIARGGSPATDRDGSPLTDAAWSAFTSFALPDGENAGPVFLAQLSGKGVRPQNKLGLWAADRNGTVRLLLRTGDEISMESGSKRLTGIKLLNSLPGSFGARRSYNAAGSLAVHATFHDKSQAILRIDVP